MMREYVVKEAGYAYVYISNDNPTQVDVYFDEVSITHTPTNIIQYNEYYPFGLQAGTSWTSENNKNDYLYNEGSELNTVSGWYETFFRSYDPTLGRFMQVDPLATVTHNMSAYQYGNNNPILLNDPTGLLARPRDEHEPDWNISWMTPFWIRETPGSGNHWSNQYHDVETNAMLMSRNKFNAYYGIQNDRDREEFANNIGTTVYENGQLTSAVGVNGVGDGNGNIIPGTEEYILYLDGEGGHQDPYQEDLAEFLQFYFGNEIKELSSMGRLTWYIDKDMKYTRPGQPGDTKSLDDSKRAGISLNPVVFTDARLLYTTVAHELVHARDILNGNWLQWNFDYMTLQTLDIMEYHAYQRAAAIETEFGVDYGSAAALQMLSPRLPTGFSYDLYNK